MYSIFLHNECPSINNFIERQYLTDVIDRDKGESIGWIIYTLRRIKNLDLKEESPIISIFNVKRGKVVFTGCASSAFYYALDIAYPPYLNILKRQG